MLVQRNLVCSTCLMAIFHIPKRILKSCFFCLLSWVTNLRSQLRLSTLVLNPLHNLGLMQVKRPYQTLPTPGIPLFALNVPLSKKLNYFGPIASNEWMLNNLDYRLQARVSFCKVLFSLYSLLSHKLSLFKLFFFLACIPLVNTLRNNQLQSHSVAKGTNFPAQFSEVNSPAVFCCSVLLYHSLVQLLK